MRCLALGTYVCTDNACAYMSVDSTPSGTGGVPAGGHFNQHHLHSALLVPGQVQSRKCIEEVIRFAFEEKLFLLADEVRAAAPRVVRGCMQA